MEYPINPTEISYNIDIGQPFGEMPNEALVKKFESTADMDDGEDAYNNYFRSVAKDWSPDVATMESDLPRRNTSNMGTLNLRYYGGRGEYNNPQHSEMFLELTENEPRGIATDPDMRKLREQEQKRMRFKRMGADTDNSVAEGRPSEFEMWKKARQQVQKAIQPRAMIFSTSKDGRREGLRRDYYPHKSNVNKVEEDLNNFRPEGSTFMDFITDWALNPQRKTTLLSNKMIVNTRLYHEFTTDHEFAVAKYGEDSRRRRLTVGDKSRVDSGASDQVRGVEDPSKVFKHTGLLMGALVGQKHKAIKDGVVGTTEEGYGLGQQARKTQALQKDLIVAVDKIAHDGEFATSDGVQSRKTVGPRRAEHLAVAQATQHQKPAHLLLNAELMYKSVQPGADVTAIKHEIVTDDNAAKYEDTTLFGKSARTTVATGKRDSIMKVRGKSMKTQVYKTSGRKAKNPGVGMYNGEDLMAQSDPTQNRKTGNARYRVTSKDDIDPDTARQFMDNTSKERRLGAMGQKSRARRYADTGHELEGVTGLN